MKNRHNQRGFTLLELTCALFVITTAGFGAIQLYSIGMDNITMMREYDVSTEVLRNAVEQLRARPYEDLVDGMPIEAPSPAMESLHKATLSVAISEPPGGPPGLKALHLTLRWQSLHGREIERELDTLIARKGGGDPL
jgi:prepilin-type N-terminal cleavage/methylation domain-containing protein